MRDLLAHEGEDKRAAEAVDLFCYVAKMHLGALVATLSGLDTLVFTGGIAKDRSGRQGKLPMRAMRTLGGREEQAAARVAQEPLMRRGPRFPVSKTRARIPLSDPLGIPSSISLIPSVSP